MQSDIPNPTAPRRLPILPLRDVVVYPHMVLPLFVGRERSVAALDEAMAGNREILLVAQTQADIDEPTAKDIYDIGTLATILQLVKLPDGTVKVLVEGIKRARLRDLQVASSFSAEPEDLAEGEEQEAREMEVLTRSVMSRFEQYIKLNKKIPPEILTSLSGIDSPSRLADMVASQMTLKLAEKQRVLEIAEVRPRLEHVLALIDGEIDMLRIEKRIRGRVKQQMEKSQREYYLNEQMKAIQKELGEMEDAPNELAELEQKIKAAGMPKDAKEKATSELNKLKLMSPMSAEATVVRNYIDWLVKVPWKKRTKVHQNLSDAEKVLEEDHYGLEKVKERILEYLAVQQRVKELKGPILCLVGPPGVGKTSLGQSIARATNRKFVRMSLGGVRDEAEIRGHRRTYIGSMPGKIVQNMSKAAVHNPLFLLDEVDKMSMDFRGDPSAALLEVLDPEQNFMFVDHYLDVEYDLSQVFFIATANVLHTIPPALQDRMEVLRLHGYTEPEKVEIAKQYLVRKQRQQTGLTEENITFTDDALTTVIRSYTREAGVRNLEREIGNICRKVARKVVKEGNKFSVTLTAENVNEYLGVTKFRDSEVHERSEVGLVTGLAWTEVGGSILTTEVSVVEGKGGKPILTGKLGDVMQESAHAAMTYVRSRWQKLGLQRDFYRNVDIHVHVPEGAIPKDGPSAGITIATAIASALSRIPVRRDIAMTGEITLRGKVLPIGGLKEKLLAAHRAGVLEVILPADNQKDLADVPENLRTLMQLHFVNTMDEVLAFALERPLPQVAEEDTHALPVVPPPTQENVPTAHQ
jgi:ATP-dependent Lon protease